MKTLLKVTAAVVTGLMLSATAYAAHSGMPKQTINVSSSQHIVKIALPANATTGYQWYVSNYNSDLLTLTAYHYLAPSTRRIGAGGTAEFEFAVKPAFHVAPQLTEVNFVYGQSWDMTGATSRTISLTSIPSYSAGADTEKHGIKKTSSHEAKKPIKHSVNNMNHTVPASSSMPSPASTSAEPVQSTDSAPVPETSSAPASNSSTSEAQSWLTIPTQS